MAFIVRNLYPEARIAPDLHTSRPTAAPAVLESTAMNTKHRARITSSVDALVRGLAEELALCPKAVADVAYLRLQKHPVWGRNPTDAHKNAAYKAWNGICQGCLTPVERKKAVFHHVCRRTPNLHAPENLKPYHTGCHDRTHGITLGSISKGAPKRRKTR